MLRIQLFRGTGLRSRSVAATKTFLFGSAVGADSEGKRRDNLRATLRGLSSAAAMIGAFMLTIVAAGVSDSWLLQWVGQREFGSPQYSLPVHAAAPAERSAKPSRPRRGDLLGRLQIPRLNLSVVVLEGSDDGVLKKGPGHIEETAFPGELGNVAIAGHRDTHFRPLRNILPGDEVVVQTKTATLRYFVDSTVIIHPTEMEVLDPTPGPTLTLVTCYPFEFIGSAPMRFVIRATPRAGDGGSSAYAAP